MDLPVRFPPKSTLPSHTMTRAGTSRSLPPPVPGLLRFLCSLLPAFPPFCRSRFPTFPLFLCLLVFSVAPARAGWSFDTGLTPERAATLLAEGDLPRAPAGSWLRLRGMAGSVVIDADGHEQPMVPGTTSAVSVARRRAALARLRAQGYCLVALIGWDDTTWKHGVRNPHGLRELPLDLREAYERCRLLAATYGDLIDYWEIGNEPDISFIEENPETYTAYLKACWWGIRAGDRERRIRDHQTTDDRPQRQRREVRGQRSEVGDPESENDDAKAGGKRLSSGPPAQNPIPGTPNLAPTCSRALMAPLALPPGPWLEAFMANGGLNYTGGFNYHYYGYAEDFSGVYRQFHAAVKELTVGRATARAKERGRSKPAPLHGATFPLPHTPLLPHSLAPSSAPSVFQTRFFPNVQGWVAKPVAGFDFPASTAAANRTVLETRPLAAGEPKLHPQGRWLATPGVTVQETPGGWIFHVTSWSPEPLRPAMAELPLSTGWHADADALLRFDYRLVPAGEGPEARHPVAGGKAQGAKRETNEMHRSSTESARRPPSTHSLIPSFPHSLPFPLPHFRSLPVFLTEYGYGLLGREARFTAAGRARQQAWFAAVAAQTRRLGLDRAMAFVLRPYLERDFNEFGLLETAPNGRRQAQGAEVAGPALVAGPNIPVDRGRKAEVGSQRSGVREQGTQVPTPEALRTGARWGHNVVSPALATLLASGLKPVSERAWGVPAATRSPVVIDFVPDRGLVQAKTSCGYYMTGDHGRGLPADGRLVLYNLSDRTRTGTLTLQGDAWSLAGGERCETLSLPPGERREIPVRIRPGGSVFKPDVARAFWRAKWPVRNARHPMQENQAVEPKQPGPAVRTTQTVTPSHATPRPLARPEPHQALFDVYFRTRNGNLYRTWQRLRASDRWQPYFERLGNYTMAFYGRARRPWRFSDNRPAALVFIFRPDRLPATFEIRDAQVVDYIAR